MATMKLTESRALNWNNLIKLNYIHKKKGRRHPKILESSLERTKRHLLGIAKDKSRREDDSPTICYKSPEKKSILRETSNKNSFVLDLKSLRSKKDSSNRGTCASSSSGLNTTNDSATDFKKLMGSKKKLQNSLKKHVNFLNTRDIEGAYPQKFKHLNKKIVDTINSQSHFNSSGASLRYNEEPPYRPSKKMVTPYKNDVFDVMNNVKVPDALCLLKRNSDISGLNSLSRNRSVDRYRFNRSYDNRNKSMDFSVNSDLNLPSINKSRKGLVRVGSSIMKIPDPATNIISM